MTDTTRPAELSEAIGRGMAEASGGIALNPSSPEAWRLLHERIEHHVSYYERDAAAQTAAAVEALRSLMPENMETHLLTFEHEPDMNGKALLTEFKAQYDRARIVLSDLSAAAEAHDKAVAERAVQPWREARNDALRELDNIRWDDIWRIVADSDPELARWSIKYLGYVRRALTTEEAESAGEGL